MENFDVSKVKVSSNFTIKPVANIINYWIDKSENEFQVFFSEPLQIIQPLLEADNSAYKKQYHLVFLRLEDCFSGVITLQEKQKKLADFLDDFKKAIHFSVFEKMENVIVIECPASKNDGEPLGEWVDLEFYRSDLKKYVLSLGLAHYISELDLFALYPMERYEDKFSYKAAMIPYTRECYTALGTIAFRKIASLVRKPYKVIVLDCDNTLWRGVVGEDGVSALLLDENFIALQQFFVNLQKNGFLLCLCSKNIEMDVWSVFDHFNDCMPLKKEHLISWRINWQAKSSNIKALSEELNLGLDSFIFLDDNPAEINEVKTFIPQVQCFQIPALATDIPNFLRHIWLVDTVGSGESDQNRTLYYKQEKERKTAQEESYNFEDFIQGLAIQLEAFDLTEDQIDRVSQMTMRTNQFNFSGTKYFPNEIRKLFFEGASKCLLISAKDRYGDYGVVASIFYFFDGASLRLDNFLLSCRALGKRIEFLIWDKLCEIAKQNDKEIIAISFRLSERNEPAQKFLRSLNLDIAKADANNTLLYALN